MQGVLENYIMNSLDDRFSIPLSILDLVMVNDNGTAGMSMLNSLDLAQKAEQWGYRRYWLAEHHNISGVASSANFGRCELSHICFDSIHSRWYKFH